MELHRDPRKNPRLESFADEDCLGYGGEVEFLPWRDRHGETDESRVGLSRTFKDANVAAWIGGERVDSVEYHTGGPSDFLLVIPFWQHTGPAHLSYLEYVRPSSSPWRALKHFASNEDLWPRVQGKRLAGRICQASDGDWHVRCPYYHDLLTWRTYWAVDLLLTFLQENEGKMSERELLTRWQSLLVGGFRMDGAKRAGYAVSAAPHLYEHPEPYDDPSFFNWVRNIPSFHEGQYPVLDYRAPYKKPGSATWRR